MPKVKCKMIIECEMELNPDHYESGSDIDMMIDVEKENIEDDPDLYFDILLNSGGKITSEFEVIE